jgi:hypothetical protein
MTCGFCANDKPVGRVFIGVERDASVRDCICCNCVLDLYVVMTEVGMRPLERVRKTPHSAPPQSAVVVRLNPRQRQ